MDPNQLLRNIVRDANEVMMPEVNDTRDSAADLAEGVMELIEWLAKDGFAPDWKKAASLVK